MNFDPDEVTPRLEVGSQPLIACRLSLEADDPDVSNCHRQDRLEINKPEDDFTGTVIRRKRVLPTQSAPTPEQPRRTDFA